MKPRRTLQLAGAALAAVLAVSAARADVTQSVNATTNATVKPAGPRTGSNGLRFFNVEGSANGTNASYGVLRFDAAPLKAAFDAQYGAGAYTLAGIDLSLVESNAAFTAPGALEFAFTPDNTTDISAANTSLQYNAATTPSSSYFAQSHIADGTFNTTGATDTGKVDTYNLLASNAGGTALANAILSGSVITLLVNDASPTVAATWVGATNTSLAPPKLTVRAVAAVPEPSVLALLFGAAPALLAARRRRA